MAAAAQNERKGEKRMMQTKPSGGGKKLLAVLLALVMLLGMFPVSAMAAVSENGLSDQLAQTQADTEAQVPVLVDGVKDQTATVQTGKSYQLDDLMDGKIFKDPSGKSLTYQNYFYQLSTDGGKNWGELTGFKMMEFGGVDKNLSQSKAGTYIYRFCAKNAAGYSTAYWTLTLNFRDVVTENVNFYVGQDQNYGTTNKYPVLELYKTAGIDENQFDYVGWFTNAEGETEYVYDPHAYTIKDGETDYVTIDGKDYELHDYEKIAFTNSAFDSADTSATASNTVVNKYNMFYATLSTGRYSTRGYGWDAEKKAYTVYLGGQSMPLPMEKDIYGGGGNDIHLGVVSVYATTKRSDGKYFNTDDYYAEMIMPITGSMIHAGTPYTYTRNSSDYTAYPFLSFEAGNGSLYNIYAYPKDTEHYMFNQSINQTTSATYYVTTKNISIANAIELKATVPQTADFQLYFQYNNFNTKSVAPLTEAVVNADQTKTLTYRISQSNGNYTWRMTDTTGQYVTKAGWLAGSSASVEKTFTFDENSAADKKTHDTSGLGSTVSTRDEADIQVFLAHSGFMSTSEKYRVRAFRMWEIIDSDAGNIMVEPEFNVQVLQGNKDDVNQVNGGNATGNWIDVKPTGTDIVAVNYNAIDMYASDGTYRSHGGLFPATAPERTGVFVITNEAAGSADANIAFNGSKETNRGSEWDYNYDTWFYMNTDTAPTLDFTVTGKANVSYAVVTTNASLQSTLSDWTSVSADESGYYHADLLKFRNAGTKGGTVIIRMTDSTGTSYRLVRVAEMSVTVTNASSPGEAFMPGDKLNVTFSGLYRGFDKVSGIFNPLTLYQRYTAGEKEFSGSLGQYQQMDRVSVQVTLPEDITFPEGETKTTYTFTNGYTYGSMYSASSPFDTLYQMTDTGVGTNFSAVNASFAMNRMADLTVEVAEKVTYTVKMNISDENGPVAGVPVVLKDKSGTVIADEADGTYKLGYGEYSYSIVSAGYVCKNGSFKLGSADAADLVDGVLTKNVTIVKAPEGAWDGTTTTEPAQVDGVYQISSGAELAWFAQAVNSGTNGGKLSAVMTADIDLAGYNWTPIGQNSENKRFAGSFDGQGHTITNLQINYAGTTPVPPYLGLFGFVSGDSTAEPAVIKNLTAVGDVTMSSSKNVIGAYSGGLIGRADYAQLTNLHSAINVTVNRTGGNWDNLGGLVGYAQSTTITNCSNSGNVTGWRYAGGIAGNITSSSSIIGCVNTGNIKNPSTCASGIVANVNTGCKVIGCYNTGAVQAGGNYAAGIAGYVGNAEVSNCFNTGAVTCNPSFTYGSLIGTVTHADATIRNLYYLEGTCDKGGIGAVKNAETQTSAAVTAEKLASADFVTDINKDLSDPIFIKGAKHPVFPWMPFDGVEAWDGTTKTVPKQVKGVYQISNAEELAWFGAQTRKTGKNGISGVLTNNIDLGGHDWTSCMIGDTSVNGTGYSGTFDGAGHTIRGFSLTKSIKGSSGSGTWGFIGFADKATIKNFTLEGTLTADFAACTATTRGIYFGLIANAKGCTISGVTSNVNINVINDENSYMTGYMGGIVGSAGASGKDTKTSTLIEDCVNNGTISAGTEAAGIVCSANLYVTIRNCMNTGNITASGTTSGDAGGIVGFNEGGLVDGCVNHGSIKGTSDVGGIAGKMATEYTNPDSVESTIQNCYNTGSVYSQSIGKNTNGVGGIAGSTSGATSKKIYSCVKNCYNTGSVSFDPNGSGVANAAAGSITGKSSYLKGINCYFLEGTAEKAVGNGTLRVTLTSVEAKSAADLKALALTLGASFKADTAKINNGYPVLTWQPGEVCQHTVTEVKNAQSATCTADGYTGDTYCKLCGTKISEGHAIAATGHKLTRTEAKAATCTEKGNSEYYTCSACGKYFRDAEGKNAIEKDSWVIAATGHNMTKTEAKAATCTEAGNSEYYTCSACGKYFSDAKGETEIAKGSWVIEATGHNMTKTAAKAATCTEAGNSEYYTCSACGKYFSDAKGENEIAKDSWIIEATGHDMTKTEAKAATCTEAGNSEYYTCSGCGKYFSDAKGENEIAKDSWIIKALGHVEVKDAAKAATCTEKGLTEGSHCSRCNTVLKAQTETPALGHVEVKDAAKAATCTETGLTEGVHCSRCNTVLKAQTETPALGHVEVKDAAKAATCTETGLTEGVHCSRCNTVLKAQTETPALGHVEVKDAAKAATCTETGLTEGVHCSRCNAVLKAQTETPALGHVEVKDAAKAATCTETGLTEGVHCSRCNTVLKAQTETPALGHDYKNGVCTRCDAKDPNYKPAAPAISTSYAASTGKPTVKWNAVDRAVKYEVYRAATRNGTYKLMGTVTGTSYTDESAYAGYTYFYKVTAVDAGGVKGNFSAIHSAICHCAKPTVTPDYLTSTGKPYIKWKAVNGAVKYQVYRAGTKTGTYKLLGTTTKTNYTDSTASAGYTYYYKVKAVSKVKSSANSAYSAAISAISHCAKPTVTPDYLTSTGKPYIKWKAVNGAVKYQVYRAGTKTGTYKLLGTTTKTNYTDSTASAGYTYYYKVKAVSKVKTSANSAYSTIVSAVCHCAKPVVKITTSSGDPKLKWSAVTGAVKYQVYRATSSGGTYTKVATTTAKTYIDKTAVSGKTYYYKVKAVSKVKTSANSAFSAVKSIRAK